MWWKYALDGVLCFSAGVYLTKRYYASVVADLRGAYSTVVKGVSEEAKKF